MPMMSKKQIAIYREIHEQEAREHIARGNWEFRSCLAIRTIDTVTGAYGSRGYIDPIDAIPFPYKETVPVNV